MLTTGHGCTCPGEVLTYECTAVGGGAMVWQGSAFNCENSNKITLLRIEEYKGTCNGGNIVGRSLIVEDNYHTSQLSVTINLDMVGKDVQCAILNETTETIIGQQIITLTGIKFKYKMPMYDLIPEFTQFLSLLLRTSI